MIEIRKERKEDHEAVYTVNNVAFGQASEGIIVDKLRSSCKEILSLVATKDGNVVGHILFSPVSVSNDGNKIIGMGLAPMAVKPELQKQGIGSSLINEGLKLLKASKCPFVVVLGHDKYYPRFGFSKASEYCLSPQWEGIPDEAFMVLFLDDLAASNISGIVSYRNEFSEEI